jgi:hypothetical protein
MDKAAADFEAEAEESENEENDSNSPKHGFRDYVIYFLAPNAR